MAETSGGMVSTVLSFAVDVLAATTFFLLGAASRSLYHRIRTRRGRQFWGGQTRGRRTLVLMGTIPDQATGQYDVAGMVGKGDSKAEKEISATLRELGIDFSVLDADETLDQDEHNLIIVGGSDVNDLPARLHRRLRPHYEFTWSRRHSGRAEPSIVNRTTRATYGIMHDEGDAHQVAFDHGILIRAQNPWRRDSIVVTIAGNSGFGTWGGVRVMSEPGFLHAARKLRTPNVECLYRVEIRRRDILAVEILDVLPLQLGPLDTALREDHYRI